VNEGGHLASITSDGIKEYVMEGMNIKGLNVIWIGGTDIHQEGVWQWTDNMPWEFTSWNGGQPDNWGGNEDCLHWYAARGWNDAPCNNEYRFLCGKKTHSGPVVELEPVTATLSSTYGSDEAAYCIDGNTYDSTLPYGGICQTNNEATPWIAIDYGTRVIVERVEIFNIVDCCGANARNIDIRISDELPTSGDQMFSGGTLLGHFAGPATGGQHIIISGQATSGRYVVVQINSQTWLNFQEVKAFGRATTL